MLVRDYMSSKVITVEPQCSIANARGLLQKHRVRQLPVMRKERVAGIVTDRDLRAASAGLKTVAEVLTAKPSVVAPDAPIDEAARLLRRLKVGALPVVENRRLVGIVTTTDVLDAFVDFCGVTEPTYHVMLSGGDSADAKWRVRRIIDRKGGDLKWIYRDAHTGTLQARVRAAKFDDIVDALEAEGFEVSAVLSPPGRRRA